MREALQKIKALDSLFHFRTAYGVSSSTSCTGFAGSGREGNDEPRKILCRPWRNSSECAVGATPLLRHLFALLDPAFQDITAIEIIPRIRDHAMTFGQLQVEHHEVPVTE